jgi:hypothetical protein
MRVGDIMTGEKATILLVSKDEATRFTVAVLEGEDRHITVVPRIRDDTLVSLGYKFVINILDAIKKE